MTHILIILRVQVTLLSWHCNRIGLKKKVGLLRKKITFLHYLSITIYRCIVIFLGQCIDTFKFCIVPSLIASSISLSE